MRKIVPFKKLKENQVVVDYADMNWIVIDTAIGKEGYKRLEQYDESGAVYDFFETPEQYEHTEKQADKRKLVAVVNETGYAVFVYGYDGVLAYK